MAEEALSDVKPWSIGIGALGGTIVGAFLWWSAYEPGLGLFQKPQLIVVPSAFGIFIVSMRNRRKKVGAWDPKNREPRP
jgi:hypothetical protein